MNDLNKVFLIGRLTKDLGSDPNGRDFGYLPNGTCKATISIASNRSRKENGEWVDDVSYFDITIWGKSAENLKPFLLKGKQVAVEAVLKQERWKDKEGNNKSRITINAMSVQLLGNKEGGGNAQHVNTSYQPAYEQNGFAQQSKKEFFAQNNMAQPQPLNEGVADTGYGGDFPEDIPF